MLASLAFLAVAQSTDKPIREGYAYTTGGKIYYAQYGNGPGTPLLVLHGGPGLPHNYLLNLREMSSDRPVIFYDQLGCGKSDIPKTTKRYTVAAYIQELTEIRQSLGLKNIFLYGHSWGTMLAMKAMLNGAPGVKGLILSSPVFNMKQWEADRIQLAKQMPAEARDAILASVKAKSAKVPGFDKAESAFMAKHIFRGKTPPPEMQETMMGMGQKVGDVMLGTSGGFVYTGTLKDYDVTGSLYKLRVPTLVTCGEFDESTPKTVKTEAKKIYGSAVKVFKNASHLTNLEVPDEYVDTLTLWLRSREPRRDYEEINVVRNRRFKNASP